MILSDVAIRRPVFTTMVIGALITFGVVSYLRIGVDLFPRVEFPVITVVTKLPGADPETIETTVTDPIEEAVNTLSGLKHLRSTSADSYSQVVVEFELDKNVDVAFQEVQARLGTIRAQLPTDIEDPIVEKFDIDSAPVLSVVLSGDKPPRELMHWADKVVKERLQRVGGVGSVRLVGGRDRKMWLWLDAQKLKQHGLTVRDVRQAVRAEHVELPGGRVETGPLEYSIKTKAECKTAADFDKLVILDRRGAAIRLKDVGYAEEGLEEQRSYAQLGGQPCISLDVRRQSGTNTVEVAEEVKREVGRLKDELKQQGLRLEVVMDNSIYIRRAVDEVQFHLLLGGACAILVVMLFLLNFRSTFISALVLPTSVIATMMALHAMGYTLNMLTLLGLTLAIGLLIDDAIVVQENIMRHVQSGKPAREAAAFATSEIGLAVLATTLSVVAVFLPVAYASGMVGRFLRCFALTVSFAVMISMFVSFTLDPMMSSRLLRKHAKLNFFFRGLEWAFEKVEQLYEALVGLALRVRWLVVLLSLGILAGSGLLAPLMQNRAEFVPDEDQSEFNVMIRAPLGASLDRTRQVCETLRGQLAPLPEVEYTIYKIGADELQRVNRAVMYVKLTDKAQRARSQQAVMDDARKRLSVNQGVTLSIERVSRISGGGFSVTDVQREIRGPDLNTLNALAQQHLARMRAAGGYVDLDTSFETGKPEADVMVNRDRAAELGVSAMDIADTIYASIGGANVGKYKAEGDRYDVAVRFLEQYRNRPDRLDDLWVPSRHGTAVELRNVAHVLTAGIPVEIHRYARQRQITVLANLGVDANGRRKVLNQAIDEVDGITAQIGLPPGYTPGWYGMAQDMKESFQSLFFTMFLSVIVVYMVLAAQFESFVHPFTIMLSLPLSVCGALGALLLFDMTVSIFTMIAFIFLLGLVTKNAILLIDYTNTLRRRDGLELFAALRRAGAVRLRPILMTTVAMIAGMLPIALGTGAGAESRQPMAVAIIGGLVSSTLLTLIVVPVVYSLVEQATGWVMRRFGKGEADGQAATPSGQG